MNHWLVKSEPSCYSWSDLNRDGATAWTGVRNYQARNHLRAMRRGDAVLYYHSITEKAVVGLAEVTRPAYPDPTAKDGDWTCVDIRPEQSFSTPVTLETIKAAPSLKNLALLRQSRLSVMPVSEAEFRLIMKLGAGR